MSFSSCEGEEGEEGAAGAAGKNALISAVAEAAGDNCTGGGFLISVGTDENENGSLDSDEVESTSYLCNGANGTEGTDGADGADGTDGTSSAIRTSVEPVGPNCAQGGFKIETGLDSDDNGTLDDGEVANTAYICSGSDEILEALTPLLESVTPTSVFAVNTTEFPNAELTMIMTSEDILPSDTGFVFGSYTDGAALYNDGNGYYTFINNLERDYSIAAIKMNSDLQPIEGEYIVNATATAFTAQCSGSSITPEEHGFGPLYLSGGEWGGAAKGVYVVNPYKDPENRTQAERLPALGEWATENAVATGKNAFPGNTVVFIGDDDSSNDYPEGHLGMYVGPFGDLFSGDLFVLRGANPTETDPGAGGQMFEMGMAEGTSYEAEWVEMTERTIDELNQEAIDSVAIGFQRIEDIDWRRGSGENERTIYFCVTGRYRSDNPDLANRGTTFGRIYRVDLPETMLEATIDDDNDEDTPEVANPDFMKATITCILDGDKTGGDADGFHSPDNILVTENYVYIQEDPNGYFDQNSAIDGWAKLYQYSIADGTLKTVLECDEDNNADYGGGGKWEITGLIDVTDIIGASTSTFIGGVQVHGWEQDAIATAVRADGKPFNDPTAIPLASSDLEGSFLFKVTGLER